MIVIVTVCAFCSLRIVVWSILASYLDSYLGKSYFLHCLIFLIVSLNCLCMLHFLKLAFFCYLGMVGAAKVEATMALKKAVSKIRFIFRWAFISEIEINVFLLKLLLVFSLDRRLRLCEWWLLRFSISFYTCKWHLKVTTEKRKENKKQRRGLVL